MKRRGPRTEPCGTPYEEVCEEERVLPHLTRKERDETMRTRLYLHLHWDFGQ